MTVLDTKALDAAKKEIALAIQFKDFGHRDKNGDWRVKGSQIDELDAACETAARNSIRAYLSALSPSQGEAPAADVVEALRETADALETLLSGDPDMPTYQADYDAADLQLERARAALASLAPQGGEGAEP